MKKLMMLLIAFSMLYTSCREENVTPPEPVPPPGVHNHPNDVAVHWNRLQMDLSRTTTGFGPGMASRAFAYSGLTLYESLVEGIASYQSLAPTLMGKTMPSRTGQVIYWPASGNAAMASIIRKLIPSGNQSKIDSLESYFSNQFGQTVPGAVLELSVEYGRSIANVIFEWSKTDGFAEAQADNNLYIVPVGPGLWEPTPPAFAAPINVYGGTVRTFVPNSPAITLPPPPIEYSTDQGSEFYNMANELYLISQSLSNEDIVTVKTWGEAPTNYNNALHYIQIAIQLVDEEKLMLDKAAIVFAQHNMAVLESNACVFNAKYNYNLVRPITYIRKTMGFGTWNTVIATPAHPEYPAAHPCGGRASSRILEEHFGTTHSFTDRTHEKTWGARNYATLKGYSDEAGLARVLGGIHYKPSVVAGSVLGEKVANLILGLPFQRKK